MTSWKPMPWASHSPVLQKIVNLVEIDDFNRFHGLPIVSYCLEAHIYGLPIEMKPISMGFSLFTHGLPSCRICKRFSLAPGIRRIRKRFSLAPGNRRIRKPFSLAHGKSRNRRFGSPWVNKEKPIDMGFISIGSP